MRSVEKRFWWYSDWDPEKFRHRILYFGGDEWHRRTAVLFSHLVVALWKFNDDCDCDPEEYQRYRDFQNDQTDDSI